MPISKDEVEGQCVRSQRSQTRRCRRFPCELLDQFVPGTDDGRGRQRRVDGVQEGVDRARHGAELGHHRADPNGADKPDATTNQRNGTTGKTVLTEDGPLRIEVPRTAMQL